MRSVCMHMARGWGITVGPACCAKDAVQCGFNTAYPCPAVPVQGCGSKQIYFLIFLFFYFSQLFYAAWVKASELQASIKLRLLFPFPRGMGNSNLLLMGWVGVTLIIHGGLAACSYVAVPPENRGKPCPFLLPFSSWWNLLLISRWCWVPRGKRVFRAVWGTIFTAIQFDLLTVTGACQWAGA